MPQFTPENPTTDPKEEKNPLDPQTVFTIKHSELIGKTQCVEHKWQKLNDSEIECSCGTVLIINPKDMQLYV